MSLFWKLRLSGIYCFGAGISFSKLQFSVRSEILFDIGSLVCCIGVFRWEELLSILYVTFFILVGGSGWIKMDSGMKLGFGCLFVCKFVCVEL